MSVTVLRRPVDRVPDTVDGLSRPAHQHPRTAVGRISSSPRPADPNRLRHSARSRRSAAPVRRSAITKRGRDRRRHLGRIWAVPPATNDDRHAVPPLLMMRIGGFILPSFGHRRVSSRSPAPSSREAVARMRATRRRDTAPELALRRLLHARGLRHRVDAPLVGTRRCADVSFATEWIAVFVDGCFWHSCPEHGILPNNRPTAKWIGAGKAGLLRKPSALAALQPSPWPSGSSRRGSFWL